MFMLKSTHRAAMAANYAQIDGQRADKNAAESAYNLEYGRANRLAGRVSELTRERDAARNSLGNAQAALTDIAGMVTPNCAHIGKRMAARAERGLGAPSVLHGAPVLKAVG